MAAGCVAARRLFGARRMARETLCLVREGGFVAYNAPIKRDS
jgi:hypothetical protein